MAIVRVSLIILFGLSHVLQVQAQNSKSLPQLLEGLNHEDPRVISESAEGLAKFRFKETEQALLNLIRNQIERGPDGLNTFIIGAATHSLEKFATNQVTEELIQLRQLIMKLPFTSKFSKRTQDKLTANLQIAVLESEKRNQKLPYGLGNKPQPPATSSTQKAELSGSHPLPVTQGARPNRESLKDQLQNLALQGDESAKILVKTVSEFLTDTLIAQHKSNQSFKILGRDQEAQATLQTLLRIKGKNPILIGPAGAGKTTVVQRLAQILTYELPALDLYQDLKDAVVIETTPARISRLALADSNPAQASALEQFFDSVLKMEQHLRKPFIVFIDELHTLSSAQIEAMKAYLDSQSRSIRLIGASTGREFNMAFKQNEAIKRRLQLVEVREFTLEQTTEIVKQTWQKQIESRYQVQFDESAIRVIVQNATTVLPENGRFDAAIKIMQDIAIELVTTEDRQKVPMINEALVNHFLIKKLGYPINPRDAKAMQGYRQELLSKVSHDVLFQNHMIESTIDLWMELLSDKNRGVRVQALLGPTGTGKSELGRSLAQVAFSRPGAFLEIDANTYKTGGMALGSLIGVPNGIKSSDQTSGILMDFLDDPSRGKFGGVILINEAERMPQDAWERLMEMLDVGRIAGGDGRTRNLNRHLIILTSNRVDKVVFPPGIEKLTDTEMQRYLKTFDNDKLRDAYKQKSSGHDQFILPDPIIARIDNWSLARPINLSMARALATKTALALVDQMQERFQIQVTLEPEAIDLMAERSFQEGMGARPVIKSTQSWLQKIVLQLLAQADATSHLPINVTHKQGTLVATSPEVRFQAELSLPKALSVDPLDDPEFAKKMKTLRSEIGSLVVGQQAATQSLASAVIAHKSDPSHTNRPLALFLVGSTGIGKTSIAKALAQALYSDPNRAEVIDLGKVSTEVRLNDVFGSSRGQSGFQEVPPFETLLRRNPEGGVIVFDEASNMGGQDKSRKEALFKQGFYSLIDEGKWMSSATGQTYDLSKFIFIFTGNDGEKLFQGIQSDELRLAIYEDNKDRSIVQKLLIESGVPEAALGRMMDVILMKPLLMSEVTQITQDILKETLKDYEQKGLRFEIPSDFYEKVALAFFSQDQGVRSIRNLIKSNFKSALAELIVESGGIETMKHHRVSMDLEDTLGKKSYVTQGSSERLVTLHLKLVNAQNSTLTHIASNLTSRAIQIIRYPAREVRNIALTEAAQALVNQPKMTGLRLTQIRLSLVASEMTPESPSFSKYELVKNASHQQTRESVVLQVAALIAGQRAQVLSGDLEARVPLQNLKHARERISQFILDSAANSDLKNIMYRDGKPHLTATQTQMALSLMGQIFQEAEAKADQVLKNNWTLLRSLTAHLIRQGSLTRKELEQFKERYQAPDTDRGFGSVRLKCDTLFL